MDIAIILTTDETNSLDDGVGLVAEIRRLMKQHNITEVLGRDEGEEALYSVDVPDACDHTGAHNLNDRMEAVCSDCETVLGR